MSLCLTYLAYFIGIASLIGLYYYIILVLSAPVDGDDELNN